MIKNSIIIIPNQEEEHEICDFLSQTVSVLTRCNQVIVIQLQKSRSIKEILINVLIKRKKFILIEKKDNISYFQPLFIIPLRRFKIISKINLKINIYIIQFLVRLNYNYKNKILWMFFPHIQYITNNFNKSWFVIYDIVDFYTLPNQIENNKLTLNKTKLLKRSNLITTISYSLKEEYEKYTNKKINVVPQGFKIINNNLKKRTRVQQNKPIVGYIGHINNRFDFNLLKNIILKNKQWNFVFVGPKHHDDNISYTNKINDINDLFKQKNVFWIKEQSKKNIYKFIQQFDICIIPYDIKYDFNKLSYPMKLFEYFYAQKPVISTPIKELLLPRFKDIIMTGNNAREWESYIKDFINNGWNSKLKKKQKIIALQNSWENKIEKISKLIIT